MYPPPKLAAVGTCDVPARGLVGVRQICIPFGVVPGVGRRKKSPGKESPMRFAPDYRQQSDYCVRGAGVSMLHPTKDSLGPGYARDSCHGE